MGKRLINISLLTVLMLMFTLIFGYTFSIVREIKAADIGHCSAMKMGRSFDLPEEDASGADEDLISEANMAKGFISRSLNDSGILYDVTIDYEDRGIIVRTLTSGVVDALDEGSTDKWNEIRETAVSCSEGWQQTIDSAGLEGWHFAIVILNDYYPRNALLICSDGKIIYDSGYALCGNDNNCDA